MKPITVSYYNLMYPYNTNIGHVAYLNGAKVVSVVKRTKDYRIELNDKTYVNVAENTILHIKNTNTFMV